MSFAGLVEAIQRRRLPHWLVVYLATAWGCAEATGFLIDNFGAPPRLLDVVVFLLAILFLVVVVLAWYHGERGPQRPTRVEGWLLGALACIAVVGTASLASAGTRPDPRPAAGIVIVDLGERSLAVLPFRSSVEDPSLAWLDRGIGELLSTQLAQLEGLRVVSGQRISDIMRQLGVAGSADLSDPILARLMEFSGARFAVTGSVHGTPGALAVSAALVDAASGEILVSADARGGDVISLVDEIAARLGRGIGAEDVGHALASVATLATGDIDAYRAYDEGRRASQRFLHEEAAAHFARAVSIDSTFALARFRLALSLYQLGSLSEAAAEARRARLDLGPASERDRLFVDAFDRVATDTTAAIATARELVRKYPDDKDARIVFASVLAALRGGADPEARTLLVQTLRLDPSYAPGYNILAYSFAASGDLVAADSLSRRYVELESDQPNAWDTRGEILELSGLLEEARGAYRKALDVRPDFRFSLNHLVRSYLEEDDPLGARSELVRFLDSPIPTVRIRALALEADTYLWEGRVDDALTRFEDAEREADVAGLNALRVWRLRDLVQLYLALGRYAAAMQASETLRVLEPLDGWWITARFDALAAVGDVAEMERFRGQVQAELGMNELTRGRVSVVSKLIDLWIAHARGDHSEVVMLSLDLPDEMRPGVLTGWPVFQSMLELGRTTDLLATIDDYHSPDLFTRGPRFQPLRVRWSEYFAARAHEAAGDHEEAVAGYEALVRELGPGLARLPVLADTPDRLERLGSADRAENRLR